MSASTSNSRAVGILGGTFDPVHFGHLRLAEEAADHFKLDGILFIPAGKPWQRSVPRAPADHRLAMVKAAIAGNARFAADEREVKRDKASYTIDTLSELRIELGATTALVLIVGADAFVNLHTWHRWQELFALSHVAVATRPGAALDVNTLTPALRDEYQKRFTANATLLRAAPAGHIATLSMTPLDISATRIRALFGAGRSARYLIPDAVAQYIQQQNLYRPN